MPREPDVPLNPLPEPKTGDVNTPDPIAKSQEASWRPYESNLGQAEPEGELDERGLREEPQTLDDRTREHGRDEHGRWPQDEERRNPPHG